MPRDLAALADMLTSVQTYIRRFVVLTPEQGTAVALYVAHTHANDAADTAPYIVMGSPTKHAGKPRCHEVLEYIVARPWLLRKVVGITGFEPATFGV